MANTGNHSTQKLLLAGFSIIVLLVLGMSALGLYFVGSYGNRVTTSITTHNQKLELAYELRQAVRKRTLSLYAMATCNDPFERDEYFLKFREHGAFFIRTRQQLESLPLSVDERHLIQIQIETANDAASSSYEVHELLQQNKLSEARQVLLDKVVPNADTVLNALDQFIHLQQAEHHNLLDEAAAKFDITFTIMLPLCLVTLVIIVLIAVFVSGKINNSMTTLADFATRIEHSEHREKLIRQSMFDAIITIDQRGTIQDFNTAAEKMFGYTEQEIIGRSVNLLMPENDSKQHDRYIANYTHTHRPKIIGIGRELLGKRKNGRIFPIEIAVTEFRQDGELVFIGTIRDITQRKEHEQALQQAKQELEQRVAQRTAELSEANELLEKLANYDSLTGLPNRLLFSERFKQALAKSRRHQEQIALLFIDLDGFKQVNDNMGHETGDTLLQEIAQRLKTIVREEDTIARVGGDEFTLIACDINDHQDAGIIADKLITIINKPITLKSTTFDIGVSIGISVYPQDGSDLDSLMHHADVAMYHAKQSGKNCYRFYADAAGVDRADKQPV